MVSIFFTLFRPTSVFYNKKENTPIYDQIQRNTINCIRKQVFCKVIVKKIKIISNTAANIPKPWYKKIIAKVFNRIWKNNGCINDC